MLAYLRSTDAHPNAHEVFEALRAEFPRLSLATVYRNLEVLVGEQEVRSVPTEVGPTRFDGNLTPHHHFVCEECGRIEDVAIEVPDDLAARLRRRYRVRMRRVRIDCYGLCSSCRDGAG